MTTPQIIAVCIALVIVWRMIRPRPTKRGILPMADADLPTRRMAADLKQNEPGGML